MTIETKKGPIGFPTWIACGFGLGFAPLAPGSISTLFLLSLFGTLFGTVGPFSPLLHGLLVLAMVVVGIPLCNAAEEKLGHDAGSIVWDEFVGFTVATWGLIQAYPAPDYSPWAILFGAWVTFRLFDVVKLWPANAAEKLPRGWGVIGDDFMAGIYANLAVRGVVELLQL